MIIEFPPQMLAIAGYFPHLPPTPLPFGIGTAVPDRTYRPGHGLRDARHDKWLTPDERTARWLRRL
jgi:hypothetical protein